MERIKAPSYIIDHLNKGGLVVCEATPRDKTFSKLIYAFSKVGIYFVKETIGGCYVQNKMVEAIPKEATSADIIDSCIECLQTMADRADVGELEVLFRLVEKDKVIMN